MDIDITNPLILIIGGILFLAILYFWNKRNAGKQRERRNRNFQNNYYKRKKEREN